MGQFNTLRFRTSEDIVEWRIRIWERFLEDGEKLRWRCLGVGFSELVQEGRELGSG